MSEALQIEIDPSDEITLIDIKWLTANGYGVRSTIDRKIKKNRFPKPAIDEGGKQSWSVAQIKRHMAAQLARVAA